jgi:Mg2+ and Co2+ transporter CorA
MNHVTNVRNEKTSVSDHLLSQPPLTVAQVNLALIATVFLPLTFFATIFGMNFQEDGG